MINIKEPSNIWASRKCNQNVLDYKEIIGASFRIFPPSNIVMMNMETVIVVPTVEHLAAQANCSKVRRNIEVPELDKKVSKITVIDIRDFLKNKELILDFFNTEVFGNLFYNFQICTLYKKLHELDDDFLFRLTVGFMTLTYNPNTYYYHAKIVNFIDDNNIKELFLYDLSNVYNYGFEYYEDAVRKLTEGRSIARKKRLQRRLEEMEQIGNEVSKEK